MLGLMVQRSFYTNKSRDLTRHTVSPQLSSDDKPKVLTFQNFDSTPGNMPPNSMTEKGIGFHQARTWRRPHPPPLRKQALLRLNAVAAGLEKTSILANFGEILIPKHDGVVPRLSPCRNFKFNFDIFLKRHSSFLLLDMLLLMPWLSILAVVLPAIYGGIHMSAWNFQFPTNQEHLLWRISCLTILGSFPLLASIVVPLGIFWRTNTFGGIARKRNICIP